MKDYPSIEFLSNKAVNRNRWDECIAQSSCGLVYATSVYLDNMCNNWTALIGNNYEWVMPLTSNKKLSIPYLYQPPFTQQLGVFPKNEHIVVPWPELIRFLKRRYPFWEINLNYATPGHIVNELQGEIANNFILSLNNDYHVISKGFSGILNKNLKRSLQNKPLYRRADYVTCVDAYRVNYGSRLKHLTTADYDSFKKICAVASSYNKLISREVADENNRTLANIILLHDGKRLYNVMNTTFPDQKKFQGNHFLIYSVIKEFAGQDIILDFEGSDLPGVKNFYESFGATNQPYFKVRVNNLSWPLSMFKR